MYTESLEVLNPYENIGVKTDEMIEFDNTAIYLIEGMKKLNYCVSNMEMDDRTLDYIKSELNSLSQYFNNELENLDKKVDSEIKNRGLIKSRRK